LAAEAGPASPVVFGGGAVIARVPARVEIQTGETIYVQPQRGAEHIFDPDTGARTG
jgi:hypothetical protein